MANGEAVRLIGAAGCGGQVAVVDGKSERDRFQRGFRWIICATQQHQPAFSKAARSVCSAMKRPAGESGQASSAWASNLTFAAFQFKPPLAVGWAARMRRTWRQLA